MSSLAEPPETHNALVPLDRALLHPLCSTSVSNWVRLLTEHDGVDRGCLARAACISFYTLINWPERLRSSLFNERHIRRTPITPPPLFILGHWRSGTTFLHTLISRDPALGFPSLWQTFTPYGFPLRGLFEGFLPRTRLIDSIKADFDAPNEEEAALAALGDLSFFLCYYFPRDAERLFRQSVFFEGLGREGQEQWKRNYLWFLRSVTRSEQGKRLVLKNPANTARIPTLLEMFPDARFIHLRRNPYEVYASTRHMWIRLLGRMALQRVSVAHVEQRVTQTYERLMRAYFEQKQQIPEGRLYEMSYEDLQADPMGCVREAYEQLDLPAFEQAAPAMREYLAEQQGYRKNRYTYDAQMIKHVREHWGFAIDRWGYEPPHAQVPEQVAEGT